MKTIEFTKMVAAGNDFAIVNNMTGNYDLPQHVLQALAKKVCDRKYGVGADGLLLVAKSGKA